MADADAATAKRPSLAALGLGLGSCVHAVPFQCRMSVLLPFAVLPAAHALLAEVATTPLRPLSTRGPVVLVVYRP